MENSELKSLEMEEYRARIREMHRRVIEIKKLSAESNILFPEYAKEEELPDNEIPFTKAKDKNRELN